MRRGLLLTLTEPPPAMEEEFNAWYDTEHLAERLAIPGFRSARRWVRGGTYLATYELDSPEVLQSSPTWKVSQPDPWSRRCLGKCLTFKRWACTQIEPGDADPHGAAAALAFTQAGRVFGALQSGVRRRIGRSDFPLRAFRRATAKRGCLPPLRNLERYAWLSIAAALATITLKTLAWWLTGSVGLLSDALESIVNLAAALLALTMLRVAASPPDENHPYGFSKAEYFAAGIEGALIVLAAAGILASAIPRLIEPQPLQAPLLGLALSAAASGINLAVGMLLIRVGRRSTASRSKPTATT